MKVKKYLVSYYFQKDEENRTVTGFGNVEISPEPEGVNIYTSEIISGLRDYICETNGFTSCVILNIIPLHG